MRKLEKKTTVMIKDQSPDVKVQTPVRKKEIFKKTRKTKKSKGICLKRGVERPYFLFFDLH